MVVSTIGCSGYSTESWGFASFDFERFLLPLFCTRSALSLFCLTANIFSILLTAMLMSFLSTSDARDEDREPIREDARLEERFRLGLDLRDLREEEDDRLAPAKSSILLGISFTPLRYGFFLAEDFLFPASKERFSNRETDKLLCCCYFIT